LSRDTSQHGFWTDLIQKRDELVRFGEHSYRDKGWNFTDRKQWLGFGGHVWHYRMLNDTEIRVTNNMIGHGLIPEEYLWALGPNAVKVSCPGILCPCRTRANGDYR